MGFRVRRFGALVAAMVSIASTTAVAQVNVTTYHNDNSRTAQNVQETILTPANVNSTQFGKLFTLAMDGAVFAQPLYLANVGIGGGTHNVVYVGTEHDSVYAIDADTGTVYWQRSLIPAGGSTVNAATDLNCSDMSGDVGITGTPVIDPNTGTLYVVAKVKLNGVILQHLHALDVLTGADKFGGPKSIQASVPGNASDGNGTMLTFNTRQENQRAALLLENGHVVIAWTSHCDNSPWHGWVMSYGATTLTQEAVYATSANGYGNGIWMSGSGLAADTSGNIYFATGNGSWNSTDRGDSILKLGPPTNGSFPLLDYFTPYNQGNLSGTDTDLAAGGVILLPTLANGQQLLVAMGKQANMYLLDRNNMGKYCIIQKPACSGSNPQIVQEVDGVLSGLWGVPAYWNGNLYWGGGNDNTGEAEPLKAYSFNAGGSGRVSTTATSVSAKSFNFSGPIPSISANGTTNAILWALDDSGARSTCNNGANCQVLYAYDATNLKNMLYNSNQAAKQRDVPGTAIKFATPTVANGKVYVGSRGALSVYGLLSNAPSNATAPTFSPASGTYTSAQSISISDTTPNAVIHYTTDGSTPTTASAVYSRPVPIATTTTLNAVATATGYANSAVSTATYTITIPPPPGSVPVSFGGTANVYGIYAPGSTDSTGGMDGSGDSYSAALLGSTVTWSGVQFDLGTAGTASAVSKATIALPTGSYAALNLLATGLHGNQVGQQFVVTYTDGTTTTITQSLSDWFTPQHYAGESVAVTMPYRLNSSGAQGTGPCYVYAYSFAINGNKIVKSITLPANRNVVVLATTLSGATKITPPPPPVVTPVNLASAANVYGLFGDGTTITHGGIDTYSNALSETQVGASVTSGGITFAVLGAAIPDVVSEATVSLPAGQFSTLHLLATALSGNQTSQRFVVTYTDGTTTTLTQSLSDWYTPQGYAGETVALTMAYRLSATGAMDARPFQLYAYSLTINNTKTVQSLTLPNNRHVVVVAATLTP